MASVPGPDPDRPLPTPAAPALEPEYEPDDEERRVATPDREARPSWMPEPYDPERQAVEPAVPVPMP